MDFCKRFRQFQGCVPAKAALCSLSFWPGKRDAGEGARVLCARKAFARRSRRFTQIRKAGLNRRTQRESRWGSGFPPFPPVRRIFICVNLRQSAGNSGFGCGWPRWGCWDFGWRWLAWRLALPSPPSPDLSHFRARSADFQSAFRVMTTVKPTASRRSGLSVFCPVHEISGLAGGRSRPGEPDLPSHETPQPHFFERGRFEDGSMGRNRPRSGARDAPQSGQEVRICTCKRQDFHPASWFVKGC